MGERECSVQRRYQKVIEETPSPFFASHAGKRLVHHPHGSNIHLHHPGLRERMCEAAVSLCQEIKYNSAGTVEFIVDDNTAEFFFLEMNTRIQVEHSVTEAAFSGVDIVELMILQGLAQRHGQGGLPLERLDQSRFSTSLFAIEARVYCENASANFKPSPGTLQHVSFPDESWIRIDTWVETGTTVTPFFDPLVAKVIVSGSTREEAVSRLDQALARSRICGPPNNIAYLRAICASEIFKSGKATTKYLDNFEFSPRYDLLIVRRNHD